MTSTRLDPWLKPYTVHFAGGDDVLHYRVVTPTGASRIAHYQFSPNGERCLRRVRSADGAVLFKEVVELGGDHPRCTCGITDHTEVAAGKLAALRQTTTRRLPVEALADIERGFTPTRPSEPEKDYDGGHLPSGIDAEGVLDWHRQQAVELTPLLRGLYPDGDRYNRALLLLLLGVSHQALRNVLTNGGKNPVLFTRMVETAANAMREDDRQAALEALAAPTHTMAATLRTVIERFEMWDQVGLGLPTELIPPPVGDDPGGEWETLGPIVRRAVDRTIHFVPRLAGEKDDLVHDGMITAIKEARALTRRTEETLDAFMVRLQRRIETAVRHDMTDRIRHQDVANRRAPEVSLEGDLDDDGPRLDVAAPDSDPFDLVFRPHETRRQDSRAQAVAIAIYRESQGLARRIIRRAYLTAFRGLRTRGTLDFQDAPDYPAASRWLADAWTRYLGQAITGGLAPVSDRVRHRARRPLAASAA